MGVIPQDIIDGLWAEYDVGSKLMRQYPEISDSDKSQLRARVMADDALVRRITFEGVTPPQAGAPRVYLATAAPPAAGKSTLLEQVIEENPARYGNMAKTDPDVYAMRNMAHTYTNFLMSPRMVANAKDYAAAQRRGYDLARPGSNIIANGILNTGIDEGYNMAHGTTMTGARSPMPAIRAKGYEIDLLVLYTPDEERVKAVEHRVKDQADYHATPEDVRGKGILFPQRFQMYFENPDNLTLYTRGGATDPAVKAVEFKTGRKEIFNEAAFANFTELFREDRLRLEFAVKAGKADIVVPPPFKDLEALYAARFPSRPQVAVPGMG